MIAVLATAAALSFAPPLDRPLRYAVIERRPRPGGGEVRSVLDQTVTFAALPDGYAMTVRATGYRSDPAGNAAALNPLVGVAIHLHVTAGGVPDRVIDGDASWAALLASLRAQVAASAPGDPAAEPAARMLAAMTAASPAARDAQLLGAADDVLGAHLPPLDIGARAATENGSVAREADEGGAARYREVAHVGGAHPIEIVSTIAIARATGLVERIVRRAETAGAAPQQVSESETIAQPDSIR